MLETYNVIPFEGNDRDDFYNEVNRMRKKQITYHNGGLIKNE